MKSNHKKLFGTDGIRGTVNGEKVNALMAVNIAMAAGEYFYGKAGTKRPRVLIGKDTRLSGYMLEPALVAGFTSLGIEAITTGPLPTPGVALLTNVLRCDLGVMISASHNPYQDNGIKLFNSQGYKLSDEVEYEIEKLLHKGPSLTNAKNLGRARRMEDAIGRYIELIKLVLKKDENLLGMKIVLDCANGAGYKVGTEALFELGCEVVSIHKDPDGTNINENCGAMFPNEMALKTKEEKADLGIALDGDADRVVFSDENGNLSGTTHDIAGGWMGWYQLGFDFGMFPSFVDGKPSVNEKGLVEGLSVLGSDHWYDVPNQKVCSYRQHSVEKAIPVRAVRSIANNYTLFALESFIDEMALELGRDPLEFRLSMLKALGHILELADLNVAGVSW